MSSKRIQDNILAPSERRLLDGLCGIAPGWVTPDRLTALALVGGGVVLAGDVAGRWRAAFLWVAILGYVMHWLGDSLDGSLARHRRIERPRYGRYVDHACDALSNLAIMTGLGLTGYVDLSLSLFCIGGYLALTIHVLLRAEALGELRISFLLLGPTELRVILVAMTLAMMAFGHVAVPLLGLRVSVYDLPIALACVLFLLLFCWNLASTAHLLRRMGG